MRNLTSIMTMTDSYKGSMYKQYPPGTEYIYSYIESRGGLFDKTVFFGLQTFVKTYLTKPITMAQIDFAEKIWKGNAMPFNREGWEYILTKHRGYMPVEIRGALEGSVIPTKNVLVTIVNTDPKLFWLTTWIETALLRAVWYPTTVATLSWHVKQVLKEYLEKSGTPELIDFKLQDFGARGVSSHESAEIGGAAHLVNFKGTDTIEALPLLMEDYHADVAMMGYSVPASEHSTITAWGRDRELSAYENMLIQFATPGSIVSVVSDSYDVFEACRMWGSLKERLVTSGATLVIRPDSGDPVVVLPRMLAILSNEFGFTKNTKGYKLLNNVNILWGDGITPSDIKTILRTVVDVLGWSADMFVFGMGGGLLQKVDRDTLKFAMKASSAGIRQEDGFLIWVDVFKDPITDPGKVSKKGIVSLFKSEHTGYYTAVSDWKEDAMVTYYVDSLVMLEQTFEEIRARSNS